MCLPERWEDWGLNYFASSHWVTCAGNYFGVFISWPDLCQHKGEEFELGVTQLLPCPSLSPPLPLPLLALLPTDQMEDLPPQSVRPASGG